MLPPSHVIGVRIGIERAEVVIIMANIAYNVSGARRACGFQFDKDLAAHGRRSLTRLFGWPWAMASRVAVR